MGPATLLAKLDIKEAHQLLSIHADDRHLLGFEWQCGYYVDGMLSFGLLSVPKVFTVVADALEWIVHNKGDGMWTIISMTCNGQA